MSDFTLPEVMASRYRLDEWLGTGGMAEVFVATDLVLGRLVAVKRLPPSAVVDETARARFAREARALARVNHPNVVTVFDAIEGDGQPFLVMELVDGTTLRDALDRKIDLSPTRALEIASGITSGLAAVHEQGIVHRDLKPSNVFLTTTGAVKIGDFGIARIASDPALTRTGEMFGSAPYIAPEQVKGDAVDARADLYALGCVMFEMLAGRPPFEGGDPMSLTYHHVHTDPTRIETLVPAIPSELASIVHQLLAKDPEDRPRTADDVGTALAAVEIAPETGPETADEIVPDVAPDIIPAITPTVPLLRTPTAVLPPRPPDAGRPHVPLSSWLPWAVLVALGAAALLVLNAVTGGDLGAASPHPRSPRTSTQSSSAKSTSPNPTSAAPTPGVGSPSEAAAALVSLVQELDSVGALGGHLAQDLEHGADEVLRDLEHGDGDKALEEIAHMRDELATALDHEEVSPDDAQRIQAAIDRLASSVDQLGSTGSGGSQDEGGNGD